MRNVRLSCSLCRVFVLALLLLSQMSAQSFEERFALSEKRAELLKELVPGSPEHLFWSVLERQHAGDLSGAQALLDAWAKRHEGTAPNHHQLMVRQSLLSQAASPEATREALVRWLDLRFEAEPPSLEADAELPTRLDQTELSDSAWLARAMARDSLLRHIGRPGLYALSANPPQGVTARTLLSAVDALKAFDLPNLSDLIVRALREGPDARFQSIPSYDQFGRRVLDDCARQMPELLNDERWVRARLSRCGTSSPGELSDETPAERSQRLSEMLELSQRLAGGFNTLKAQVLLHCLDDDRRQGRYDRARFEAYLRLPHATAWAPVRRAEESLPNSVFVDWNRGYSLNLGPRIDEEELIRDYLAQFLVDATDYAAWTPYVKTDWLRPLFAEVKLLAGKGDAAQYTAMLQSTEDFEALRRRRELRFPKSVPTTFARNEPVRLSLDTKNIELLRVRIFRLDAAEWFSQTGQPLNAWLSLSGLVPHHERVFTYEDAPLLRVRRTFEFPECSDPGAYAVEFIGGGLSSRAVFQKGSLRHAIRKGSLGQVFQVFDEAGQPLMGAKLRIGAQSFEADTFGEIVLPFAGRPTQRKAVLTVGAVSELLEFEHLSESYSLWVGAAAPRSAMIEGKSCQFLVRTELSLNDTPIDLSLLKDVTLDAEMTTLEGESMTRRIEGFLALADRESLVEVDLKEGLSRLQFTLSGEVKSLATGEPIRLVAKSLPVILNESRESLATRQPELERTASGYRLAIRGMNGETIPRTLVDLALWHEDWIEPHNVRLRTDDAGFVDLGPLRGLRAIQWNESGHEFRLDKAEAAWPARLVKMEGEPIQIPGFRHLDRLGYGVASLYSLRENRIHDSYTDRIRLVAGELLLEGLEPGDYRLELHCERKVIAIRVLRGLGDGLWCFEQKSTTRLSNGLPLGFAGIEWTQEAAGAGLRIELRNWTPTTRVHLLAHAYDTWDGPTRALTRTGGPMGERFNFGLAQAQYASERQLSDEERYILERRSLEKFAGNMLERPSVLLNPWSDLAVSYAEQQKARLGGSGGGARGGRGRSAGPARSSGRTRGGSYSSWLTLSSLKEPTVILANLTPDAEGRVFVDRKALGIARVLEIQAIDRDQQIAETLFQADVKPARRDLTLAEALPVKEALVEAKVLKAIAANEEWVAESSEEAQFRIFKDLASVYRHYRSTSEGAGLQEFEYLIEWQTLSLEERLNAYSRTPCHEVNLFLKRKDPAFFRRIIEPWLRHKVGKTFMDEYLLDENLAPWLAPDRFARLNLLERILLLKREPTRRGLASRHLRDQRVQRGLSSAGEDELAVSRVFSAQAQGSLALAAGQSMTGLFSSLDLPRPEPSVAEKPKAKGDDKNEELMRFSRRQSGREPGVDAAKSEEPEEEENDADEFFGAIGGGGGGNLGSRPNRAVLQRAELEKLSERDLARRELSPFLALVAESAGPTLRYVERNYFGRSMQATTPELIEPHGFWRDFAEHSGETPFCSPRFALAAAHLNEMLLALAVLDLPISALDPEKRSRDGKIALIGPSPLIVLGTELQKRPMPEASGLGLVLQTQIFAVGEAPKTTEVPPELLVARAYMLRLTLLNPTEDELAVRVLNQIPVGAIALDGGRQTRPQRVQLAAGGRVSFEIPFVFPQEGEFLSLAAHVSLPNGSVQLPKPMTLRVVRRATRYDEKNWESVTAFGTVEEVLSILEEAPLTQLDFNRILWRMRDAETYRRIIAALESKLTFVKELWAYSLLHGDWPRVADYLASEPRMAAMLGQTFEGDWWRINPYERGVMEHVTFKPHVNARIHPLGEAHALNSAAAKAEWDAFIQYLCRRPKPSAQDLFAAAAWLILQDRLVEASEVFARIDKGSLSADLQYDAMNAWLAMCRLDLALAKEIAERHKDHPIAFWRERFAQMLGHLEEARTDVIAAGEPTDREGRQSLLASQEPTLDFEIQGEQIIIQHRNLAECSLRLFTVDTELQFSNNPFAKDGDAPLPYIAPNHLETIALPEDGAPKTITLPAAFRQKNAIIALEGKGVSRRKPRYANGLNVQVIERFGRLRVGRASDGRPLPKVYVKVYADFGGGRTEFYKDGYTDIRGAFDYLLVTQELPSKPRRLSILIASDELGFEVREVRAPVD